MQANTEHLKRAAAGSLANFGAKTVSARGHNAFMEGIIGQAETPEFTEELKGYLLDAEAAEGGVTDAELQSKDPPKGGSMEARVAALEAAAAAPEATPEV